MYVSVHSEYIEIGNDKDERFLNTIYIGENIPSSAKIELFYYTVKLFPKICIHCGASGISQTLGNLVDHYPQIFKYKEKPDILRL